MNQAPRISAFIVCSNEEDKIRRCLESVSWCDEVVVIIDEKSQDKTESICRELATHVHIRAWQGYVSQKRFGLSQCRGEWILNLDADEEISPELRDEILAKVVNPAEVPYNGFLLNRVVFYLGRWWRKGGWYPEYRMRLCRRSVTTWGGEDPHEKASVEGRTSKLHGELRHYTYRDMTDHIRRLNSYSSTAAKMMHNRGKKVQLRHLVFNPIGRFVKFFFLKKGFREGFAGLLVAVHEAYYVFLKYAKLWELQSRSGESLSDKA